MKLLLTAALMSLSLSSLAASVSCDILPILADKGGYSITGTAFVMKTEVQKGKFDASKCQAITKSTQFIHFCATESEFVGGIDAALLVVDNGATQPGLSRAVLGTSRKNSKETIKILGDSQMLHGPSVKFESANVQFPQFWDGADSLLVDDAVKEGFRLNLLNHNEVLYYVVYNCKNG